MKKLEMGGEIISMSRITGALLVTLKHDSGTYFDVAVGDLPIPQEEIEASIGKRLNFKVEAEIIDAPKKSAYGWSADPKTDRELRDKYGPLIHERP